MRALRLPRAWNAGLLAAGIVMTGCGSDSPTSPGIQPQIANLPDDFSYQVSAVTNFTGVYVYAWENTGVAANINQATTVTAGTITLQVTDANRTQVYSRSLSDNGTFVTANGVAGTWRLRLSYAGASGTVNFRVQKKT